MQPGILAEGGFESAEAAGQADELVARIQGAFGAGGAARAIHIVKSGMTAEEMLEVAEGRGLIVDGGPENGLIYQPNMGAPQSAKASASTQKHDETHGPDHEKKDKKDKEPHKPTPR